MIAGAPRGAGRGAAVRLERISKTFPGTRALQDVSLAVRQGEIHGLVGGNGSGKSTLIKVLAGIHAAEPGGLIEIKGHPHTTDHMSTAIARDAGLRFVHQQRTAFPSLSVAENLAVGRGFETGVGGRIRWRALRQRAGRVLERFGIDAAPSAALEKLGPAQQSMVAIARALQDQDSTHDGILVLDEPTAPLARPETKILLDALRRYAAAGQTILYVSHKLHEVLQIADRLSVLRDGRLVATVDAPTINHDQLVELIVGRAVESVFPSMPDIRSERPTLEVRDLAGGAIRSATFALRQGEVLGIAGLLGSGRSSLLQMIFGVQAIQAGEVRLDGRLLTLRSPRDAVRAGIAYVPEDRANQAAFFGMTVGENLLQGSVGEYWRNLHLHHSAERADARHLIDSFLIRTPSETAPLDILSGGNQQKVVLARWLRQRPRLLLLDDPTRGVDVGARAELYALLRDAIKEGVSALIVCSELEELARVSDRVLILDRGRIVAEVGTDPS